MSMRYLLLIGLILVGIFAFSTGTLKNFYHQNNPNVAKDSSNFSKNSFIVINAFLKDLTLARYDSVYNLLSNSDKKAITLDHFKDYMRLNFGNLKNSVYVISGTSLSSDNKMSIYKVAFTTDSGSQNFEFMVQHEKHMKPSVFMDLEKKVTKKNLDHKIMLLVSHAVSLKYSDPLKSYGFITEAIELGDNSESSRKLMEELSPIVATIEEKSLYRPKLKITDLGLIRHSDSSASVKYKLKNTGIKTIKDIVLKLDFLNKDSSIAFSRNFRPLHRDNRTGDKQLRPGKVLSSGFFGKLKVDDIPSSWKNGYIRLDVLDFSW